MRMNANVEEAISLLAEGGVLTRLKDEARVEKETERAALLEKLAQVERAEATRAAEYVKVRAGLEAAITELEAKLRAARHELAELAAPTGATPERLRGQLRRLADPKIAAAINQLSDLFEKARHQFVTRDHRVRTLHGRVSETTSNAVTINGIIADIKRARLELESLQEAARPDDLDAVIAAKLDPIRQAVRKLHGL